MYPKILIVDDDASHLLAIKMILNTHHFRADCCTSAEDALDRLRRETFDILITDLHMHEMDGLALITAARQIRPKISTILMTGLVTPELEMTAKQKGVDGFFSKPLDWDKLIGFLNTLEKKRNDEAVREHNRSVTDESNPKAAGAKLERVPHIALLASENEIGHVPKGENKMGNTKKKFIWAAIIPVFILAGVLLYITTFTTTKEPVLTETQIWERNNTEASTESIIEGETSSNAESVVPRQNEMGRSYTPPSENQWQNNEQRFMRGQGRGNSLSRQEDNTQDQRAGGRGRGQGQGQGRGRGRGYDGLSQNRNNDSFRYQDEGVRTPE
ncbi:MAG: response regulator [Deltaproteobacteria bacterium]|nr:response regulator [Deltaproteobacteria bacterium]